jgi:glycosyltransferase involved in cell wall biosynthesis
MNGTVLFLDQYNQLGGAQRCLLDLLPAFLEAGYVAHLAIPGGGPLTDATQRLGVVTHSIPCSAYTPGRKGWRDAASFGADLPRQAWRIASLVSERRIDLIYVNGPRLLPAAAIGARSRHVVFHAHSVVTQQAAARLSRWALRSTNATVIAACQFVLQPLLPSIQKGRSRVIYNGVACMARARRQRLNNNPWRIGVIGRIAPEKGQLEFIHAARLVLREQSCEFLICGDPQFSGPKYERRVRREAEGLPIEFTGWRNDVGEVLSTLDVLVVPSAAVDATPRVILEAFSAGVPVVAFRSGGIPEIVEDGVTGALCAPTAPDLAAKLLELFSDGGAQLDGMSYRARAAFSARFCLERYRSEVLDAVQRVCSL